MHPHGLQSLSEGANTALLTLAAKTALNIDSALVSITRTFLLKRVRYWLMVEALTTNNGPIVVGLNFGNASIQEVTAGMNVTNTVGPADVTQSLTQDEAWKIIRNSVEYMKLAGGSTTHLQTSGRWHTMPGKGIPLQADSGVAAFVFNCDTTALDTGAQIKGVIEYQGVWLRD